MGRYFTTQDTVYRDDAPFTPKITSRFSREIQIIDELHEAVSGLRLPFDQEMQLIRDAKARNAYGTASIEGNPLTLAQVESLMEKVPSPSRDLVAAEVEILQWYDFMQDLENKQVGTTNDFLAIHEELLSGVVASAGQFKEETNSIGDNTGAIHYIASRPEKVIPELESILSWYRTSTLHPLIKIGLFFHEFQSIHPFADGNGRVGRAIATIQLHQAKYDLQMAPLDFAINAHQHEYYDALQSTRVHKDPTHWIRFWLQMITAAFRSGLQRATLHRELPGLPREAVRIAEWAGRIQIHQPRRQFAFADIQSAFPEIAERTLRRQLALLVQEHILSRSGAGRGSRYQIHDSLRTRSLE